MNGKILIKNGKYYAYLDGVYVGNSTHKDGAENLIKSFVRALDRDAKIVHLEKRIRKFRNSIFDFENAGANVERMKKELIFLRAKNVYINVKKLKAALKIH